jgi:ligand-binding sensor domain-containing protein
VASTRIGFWAARLGALVFAGSLLISACTTRPASDSGSAGPAAKNLTGQGSPEAAYQRNPDLDPGPIPPIALAPPVVDSLTRAQLTNPDTNTALVVGLPGAACVKGLTTGFCKPEDNVTEVCVKDVTQDLDVLCQKPSDNGAFSFTLTGAKENDEVKIWTNGPNYLQAGQNSLNAVAKTILSVATAILRSGPWIFVGSGSEGLYIYKQDPAGKWPLNTVRVQRLTVGDGLPCNGISSLAQAAGKKVWVGSKCGLRRIDFDPDRNRFSLDATFLTNAGESAAYFLMDPIYSLLDDGPNAVWVGGRSGWMRIEAGADGKFVSSATVSTAQLGTPPDTVVDESGLPNRFMAYDDNHDLWISGGYKLRRIRANESTEGFSIEGVGRGMTISSLIRDGDHLWVSLIRNVLIQVHFTTDPITGYRKPDFKRIPIVNDGSSDPIICPPVGPCWVPDGDIPLVPTILSLAPVGDGTLYVGGSGGVRHAVFTGDTGAVVDADVFARDLGSQATHVLVSDESGGVYTGGMDGFGFIADPDRGRYERYTNPAYLLSNRILSLGAATSDTVWVGQSNGLSRVDITRNFYAHYPIERSQIVATKGFSMIAADGVGGAWAYYPQDTGADFDQTNSALVHAAAGTGNTLSTGLIDLAEVEGGFGKTTALYPAQSGVGGVSVAMFRGIFEVSPDPKLGLNPVPIMTPKALGMIRATGMDDLGRRWFALGDGQTNWLLDASTSQTHLIGTGDGDLQVTPGNSVIGDGKGGLLIGSNQGILHFRDDGVGSPIKPAIHLDADFSSDVVQALQPAGDGKFWAATATIRAIRTKDVDLQGGLYLVELGEGEPRITRFSAADYGLPSDGISSLASNPDGSVWVGTDNGLALFVPPPLQ